MNKPRIGITLDIVDPTIDSNSASFSKEPWYALRYRYADAVSVHGGLPLALPHHIDLIPSYVETLDGLLITGGGFDVDPSLYGDLDRHPTIKLKPNRTAFEFALCEAFLKADKPILGICGGMQLLNVVLGGSLHQHLPDIQDTLDHAPEGGGITLAHTIHLSNDTMLSRFYHGSSAMLVNSAHHQAVRDLSPKARCNAMADDGIIEGFEVLDATFAIGIQWHPEFLMNDLDHAIFKHFIRASQSL